MLRWLVGSLLRSTARQKLARAFSPAEETAANPDPSGELTAAAATHFELAVISADTVAANGLTDRLAGAITTQAAGFAVRTGRLARRRVAVATPRGDADVLAPAAQALVDAYRPNLMATIGFGVALTDDLAVGDLVVASRIASPRGAAIVLDVAQSGAKSVRLGTLVTLDTLPNSPPERHALGIQYRALAAEMSAYPVADVCRRAAVPMLAVAAITTSVEDQLPPDLQHLVVQKSRAGVAGALFGSLWRRPSSAKDLWHRQEIIWQASDRLADFLEALLA